MKILQRYILKEMIAPTLLSLAVFTFVLLIGNLVKLAEMVVARGVPFSYVGRMFLYMIPYLFSYTIPMAMLTGTLLVFGQLSYDNEITAMRSSGMSILKIAFPVIVVSLLVSLFSVHLNDKILPRSHWASRRVLSQLTVKNPTAYLEEGTFIKTFPGHIIFIYDVDKYIINNVRIYQPQPGKPTRTIIAQSGTIIPLPKKELMVLRLYNGTLDEPNPNEPGKFYKLNFRSYDLPLSLEGLTGGEIDKKPKDMTIDEIKKEIVKLDKKDIDSTPLLVEIHKKISLSFSSFVFVLIGLPLAIVTKRSEKSIGFGLSLGITMCYWLGLVGGEAIARKALLVPSISMWLPNIVLGLVGLVLIAKVIEG